MTDAPIGGQSLGSAHAEVGWTYRRREFEQFLADASRAQQAIEQVAKAVSGASIQLPTGTLQRQVATDLQQLKQQVASAKPFEPLTRDLAQATADIEKRLQQLIAKRDSLRQIIAGTGLSASERSKFFDNQGRARSNTSDDQRLDSAAENARRGSTLSTADQTPNAIRAEIEKANEAAQKLRGVLAEIKSLKDQGAGSRRGQLAEEYVEAARAAEQFGQAAKQARTAQAEAQQRVDQTQGRTGRLQAIVDDETASEERRGKAWGLAAASAQQLAAAQEKLALASEQAAAAEAGERENLQALEKAQAQFNRGAGQRRAAATAPQAAAQTVAGTAAPAETGQLVQASEQVSAAYATLDQAVSHHIEVTARASATDLERGAALELLREAIDQATAAQTRLSAAESRPAGTTQASEVVSLLHEQSAAITRLGEQVAAADVFKPVAASAKRARASVKSDIDQIAAEVARVKAQEERLAQVPIGGIKRPASPRAADTPTGAGITPLATGANLTPEIAATEQLTAAQRALNTALDASQIHEQRLAVASASHAERVALLEAELRQLRLATDAETASEEQRLAVLRRIEGAEIALVREEAAVERERQAAARTQSQTQEQLGTGALRGGLRGLGGAIGGGLIGGLGAAGGAAIISQQLVQAGRDSIELADKAETIGTAFEAATKRAGIASGELVARLQEAARGTVATTELEQSANKALALGVGRDAQQIADLLAIARQKGKDFGLTTAQSFEDITTGLGRLSPRILDNLGIIIDENKVYADYAKSLGVATDKLSDQEKRQALVNDLIRNNSDLIQKNADATIDAQDRIAAADARRQNAEARAGKALSPFRTNLAETVATTAEGVAGLVSPFGERGVNGFIADLAAGSRSFAEFQQKIDTTASELLGSLSVTDNEKGFLLLLQDVDEAQFAVAQSAAHVADAEQNAGTQVNFLGAAYARLLGTLGQVSTALTAATSAALAGGPHDPVEDARRDAARRAENEAIKTRQANQQQLITDTIAGSDQLLQKRKAVSIELGNLETQYTQRVAEGQAEIVKTYADAATEIGQVVAKGAEDRKKIETDNADQISRLIRDHTQQDARNIEDQSRADARDAQDFASRRALDNQHFAEQEAASQAAFNESRAQDNKHFAEQQAASDVEFARQREQLLVSQHDAQVRRDEDFARQEQRAREVAQAEEIRSTENFVTRLFEATRGRGGAGKRAEANQQLAQARAEAAELAKTDAAAAAAYLAERQRQILEGLDVAASNRQLRKDAKRGGALGRSEAEAEIAAEQQARDDANKAALDLIRQQAKERADDRAREQGDQATADKTALDDLDKQHAEQKQKAIDAHKEQQDEQDAAFAEQKQHAEAAHAEQQKEEDAARAEALKRRDADRATEKKRRDADYAQQLQDLKDSNAKRLHEFDLAQADRIKQIGDQADKQATATKTGLEKVDAEYTKARAKVLADYAIFIGELESSLSKEADNLDMLPSVQRQKDLSDAYKSLGETLGQSLADGIAQSLAGSLAGGLIGPPIPGAGTIGSGRRAQRVPGGIIFDDNTANDPRPNQAGVNSVVAGGVVGDTFDARRPNSTIVHQGIDIRVQDGTPVHAPYDLTDLHVGYYADADRKGWYVTGIDPFGREWYFGHLAKPTVKEGGSVKKGGVVGVVAAGLGHVHVQLKPRRGNDVTPTDPSAALDAAGAAPAPTPPPPPRRAGGAQAQRLTGGQRIAVPPGTPDWAIPGSDVWGPTMGLPARAVVAQTVDASVTIDLSGSTFGPGLTRDEVEGWFRPVVDAALRDNHGDGRRDLLRRIGHFDAQGALRS